MTISRNRSFQQKCCKLSRHWEDIKAAAVTQYWNTNSVDLKFDMIISSFISSHRSSTAFLAHSSAVESLTSRVAIWHHCFTTPQNLADWKKSPQIFSHPPRWALSVADYSPWRLHQLFQVTLSKDIQQSTKQTPASMSADPKHLSQSVWRSQTWYLVHLCLASIKLYWSVSCSLLI